MACRTGVVESVRHFVVECPSYAKQRSRLTQQVCRVLDTSATELDVPTYDTIGPCFDAVYYWASGLATRLLRTRSTNLP